MAGEPTRDGQDDATVLAVLPPRFALIELGLFALVILAELLVPAFPDLTRYNPHAYWIPVLLLSLQYGTVSGLLAALMATAGTVLIGLPEPEIGESYFSHLIRAWTQPVLWLVVALLLGAFRVRQIETKADLARRAAEMSAHANALAVHATKLEARCDQLERRLVTAPRPETDRLLEGLAALDAATTPPAVAAALARVAAIALPDGRGSLLVRVGDRFEVAQSIGGSAPPGTADVRALEAGDPLVRALAERGHGLSVMTAADERLLAGRALSAVPVREAGAGTLSAILLVEALAPRALDARLLDRLQVVASHLAAALARGAVLAPAEAAGVTAPEAPAALEAPGGVVGRLKVAALPLIRRWRQGSTPVPVDAASRSARGAEPARDDGRPVEARDPAAAGPRAAAPAEPLS